MSLPITPRMSLWQRGCDDGKAGRPPVRPAPNAETWKDYDGMRANEGYMNGYRYGMGLRYEPTENEGSEP